MWLLLLCHIALATRKSGRGPSVTSLPSVASAVPPLAAQSDNAPNLGAPLPSVASAVPIPLNNSSIAKPGTRRIVFFNGYQVDYLGIIEYVVKSATHPLLAPHVRVLSHYLNKSSGFRYRLWGQDVTVSCNPKRCWLFNAPVIVPGITFRVGMELEAVVVGTGEPIAKLSRFFYATEVFHATANPFEWNPEHPSVSGFLVATGATTSKLRVEDILDVPMSSHASLGVVLPGHLFLRTMVPILRVGGHKFSSPIFTPALVPFATTLNHSTNRLIGVDLMLRFAQVNFECGSVSFFPFRVPDPSGKALSSNRVELRKLEYGVESTILDFKGSPTQFYVTLEYLGEKQKFLIDTGSDSTHVPPLDVAEPTYVVETLTSAGGPGAVAGTRYDIYLYPLTLEILGRAFSTEVAQFHLRNGESYVLGSDILSQFDVRFVRDEKSAQIHIWDRCNRERIEF